MDPLGPRGAPTGLTRALGPGAPGLPRGSRAPEARALLTLKGRWPIFIGKKAYKMGPPRRQEAWHIL